MERRLSAILAADLAGYTALMAVDEAGTLRRLTDLRHEFIEPLIDMHHGRVVKLMGDGLLVEFASVVDAVACACAWQDGMTEQDTYADESKRLLFRIGINLGDVIVEGDDIHGDGVNIAARIEGLAEPGGICISGDAYRQARGKVDAEFEELGEHNLKNVAEPVTIYKVLLDIPAIQRTHQLRTSTKRSLPWVLLTGGLVLLAILGGVVLWQKPWAPREEPASVANMAFPLPDKPSIAVLPFNNMSDDASQEYFADGMTEDVITDLSKVSGLFVIARNSSFSYKGQQVKVRQVAEELGVRYVLEGSIRRAGDEVRINAQLIDAGTGGHLWADRYDGTLENIFDLQDQVTRQIVTALALELTAAEQKQAYKETENPEAYDAFLQGWEYYRRLTAEDFSKAIPYFEKAAALDPDYGRAYAALAAIYFVAWRGGYSWTDIVIPGQGDYYSWMEAIEKSKTYLELAMNDPTPLALKVASRVHVDERQFADGIAAADRAVQLDPNDPEGHLARGLALIAVGRAEEAIAAAQEGLRLDPHYPWPNLYVLGLAQIELGDFREAVATLERVSNWPGASDEAHAALAIAYAYLNLKEQAATSLKKYTDTWRWPPRVERVMEYWPFQREVDIRLFGGGLIKAGLCCEDRLEEYISVVRIGGTME